MFNKNNSSDVLDSACSTDEEKRNSYFILVENPEGNKPSRSPKHRRVTNTTFI
jgi:hypothetical protein